MHRFRYDRESAKNCLFFTIVLATNHRNDERRSIKGQVLYHSDTLRLVAQAQGGLAGLARKTSVSRQSLHEALSPDGNPRLRTFQSVLDGIGIRMSFKPVHRPATVR